MHGLIIDLLYDRCPRVDLSLSFLLFYFHLSFSKHLFLLHGGLPGISFLPRSSSAWMGSFFLIIFSFRDSIVFFWRVMYCIYYHSILSRVGVCSGNLTFVISGDKPKKKAVFFPTFPTLSCSTPHFKTAIVGLKPNYYPTHIIPA